MAKTEAAAVAATPKAFELDEIKLSLLAPKGGRQVKPSAYLEEVRAAIGQDKAYGIAVPAGVKGSQIVSELHKAAKQLDVKVKVWNRETAEPPFVGFKHVPVPVVESSDVISS